MSKVSYILAVLGLTLFVLLSSGCTHRFKLDRTEANSAPTAWPFYRDLPNAQASKPSGKFSGMLDVRWERRSNDKPAGPLTLAFNNLVYPGTRNKVKIYACSDGTYQGYVKAGGNPQTGMAVGDSLGYFAIGPYKSELKCINLLNRKQLWHSPVKDAASGSIIVEDLLIVGSENTVVAFNRFSGKKIWSKTFDDRISAPASFGDGRLYQPTDDGTLYALNIADGSEFYHVKMDGPMVSAVTVGDLVYATDMKGDIVGIDPDSGQVRWQTKLDGPIWTSPSLANGKLFIGHSGGVLAAVDAASGSILWKYDAVDVIRASAIAVDGCVIFGTMSGKLYSLKAADGSLIQERELKGAIVRAPVSDGANVYVATDKGYILCFGEIDEQHSQPD